MFRRVSPLLVALSALALLSACTAGATFEDRHPGAKRANTYGCPCR